MESQSGKKLAITLGDPAGIGPEVIVKSLASIAREKNFSAIIFGSKEVLEKTAEKLKLPSPQSLPGIEIRDLSSKGEQFFPGKLTEDSAKAQIRYIREALIAIENGECSALMTGPIHKKALRIEGLPYRGHTEWLEYFSGQQTAMLMSAPELTAVPLTEHIPLSEVKNDLNRQLIVRKTKVAFETLLSLFKKKPKLAICGLNPHAGDGGLLGWEEREFIEPAIRELEEMGIPAVGPIAADTAFTPNVRKKFDLIIGMYHDQVLPPIKALYFSDLINITGGLPFLRTSPDHGVAYDIAGRGIADHRSCERALRVAIDWLKSNQERQKPL